MLKVHRYTLTALLSESPDASACCPDDAFEYRSFPLETSFQSIGHFRCGCSPASAAPTNTEDVAREQGCVVSEGRLLVFHCAS